MRVNLQNLQRRKLRAALALAVMMMVHVVCSRD
jgi:hypothetical protein